MQPQALNEEEKLEIWWAVCCTLHHASQFPEDHGVLIDFKHISADRL